MKVKYDIDKAVGQSLATHRLACKMTQAQVAEALGLSVDAISRMERGTISLTLPKLMMFARLYNCKLGDFISESSPIVSEQVERVGKILDTLSDDKRLELINIIEKIVQLNEVDKNY